MKKFFYICALAAIAATALSCNKETTPVKMKTISVDMGCPEVEPASKTQLYNNTLNVYWSWGDKNIVCFTNNSAGDSKGYGLSSTQNGTLASKTFTGEIPDGDEPMFYIFDRNRTESGNFAFKKGSATYFAVFSDPDQRLKSAPWGNTFHTGCNYAIALPGDATFTSVFGYLKWTNHGTDIKSVKMEPLVSNENIVGQIKISLKNGALVFEHAWNSTLNYILTGINADNSNIPENNSYYAIVYPREYNGLKLTITLASGGEIAIKTPAGKTVTVERGKYFDLGVLPIVAPAKAVSGMLLPGTGDMSEGWILE